MNARERVLAGIVATVVLALVNLFLWSGLLGAIRGARADVAKRKLLRNEQLAFLRDGDLWTQRDQWLREHQPVYKGAADATALLDQLKGVAGKNNVLIENPQFGSGETKPAYQSVSVSIETKSPWPPLVHFLYDMQMPESFTVFESVNLAVDSGDATQMRGKFKVARWYAAAGGGNTR
ncbi:MAG: GspMb/PilO family protein [Chthoniobacterales bacterium]